MNICDLKDVKGLKATVVGLGRSGEAVIAYLQKKGADIYVSDKNKSEKEITDVLQKNNIKKANIVKYGDFPKSDLILRSPGIRCDSPEITSAIEKGAFLTSEAELFFSVAKGRIFGITGSDGKTTTSTVAYEMLKSKLGKDNVHLGGNIGIPLISLIDSLSETSITVCELSSFQLMKFAYSPERAVITNITENHLDYHKDMGEYVASKCNIFKNQGCERLVIDNNALKIIKNTSFHLPNTVITSSLSDQSCDVTVKDGNVSLFGNDVIPIREIKAKGRHNVSNFMSAISLCYNDVEKENILKVANEFNGVKHRMEFVCRKNGISFYNSSIDSTPSRTLATLRALDEKDVTLILGGYDKNLDFSELSSYIASKNYTALLIGANSEKIERALKLTDINANRIIKCKDLYEAVITSLNVTRLGGTVILSPASASFDAFKDFEERGISYINIINSI